MRRVRHYGYLTSAGLGLVLWGGRAGAQADAAPSPFTATELLGRPTAHSVDVSAITDGSTVDVYFEYDTVSHLPSGAYPYSTGSVTSSDSIVRASIAGLEPDTRYYYRMLYRAAGAGDWTALSEHSFHTQRSAGSTFVFTITSDAHQGNLGNSSLWAKTLGNVLADSPDFHLDLGDLVSTDDNTETQTTVRAKYLTQRENFAIVAHSVPIFLAPGNHENEEGWNLDDMGSNEAASLPVLGANARKRYFLNPVPSVPPVASDFYTGNTDDAVTAIDGDHLKGDYYSFEWGDALFVVFDPFWYTMSKPYTGSLGGEKDDETVPAGGNRWAWTLGDQQHHWLEQTLRNSHKPYKFMLAHHPTTGTSSQGDYSRGGVQAAPFCEWGGHNLDGTWGFDEHRPNWEQPIHSLMVETGVTILFHGHDHEYAYETLDGIVYQECPMAADASYGTGFQSLGAYSNAIQTLNNSGHLRVTVSPSQVQVEYVHASLSAAGGTNGSVASVPPNTPYTTAPVTPNQRPRAVPKTLEMNEDNSATIDVALADSDPDGQTLSVVGFTQPTNGSAIVGSVALAGTVVTYTPPANYCNAPPNTSPLAPDSFNYTVSDGHGAVTREPVSVIVHCVNDPPVARNFDGGTTRPGQLLSISVPLGTDVDPEGDATLNAVDGTTTHGGAASKHDDGHIDYTSKAAFTGDDTFGYRICDADYCSSGTVTVHVQCAGNVDCDDSDTCTTDSCASGSCGHAAKCDDGLGCTIDSCAANGSCTNTPNCPDDGDLCTNEICTATGCQHEPKTCNSGQQCSNGVCVTLGTGGSTGAGGNMAGGATGAGGSGPGGSATGGSNVGGSATGGSAGVGGSGVATGGDNGAGGGGVVDCDAGDDAEAGVCGPDAGEDAEAGVSADATFLDAEQPPDDSPDDAIIVVEGAGGTGAGGSAVGAGGDATGLGGDATGLGGNATGLGGNATGLGGNATGLGGNATGLGGNVVITDGALADGDARSPDAARDAEPDAPNSPSREDGSCTCTMTGGRSASPLFGLLVGAMAMLARRRRRG